MKKGFTILELLIYIGLFSLLIVAFLTMLVAVTTVQTQQNSTLAVNGESQKVLQDVQYYTELSSAIDMPGDTATTTLTLRMANSSTDPTVFSLQNGQIYMKQGNGPQTALTSNKVTVSGLSFTKRSNAPSHDSVSVAFTLSYNTNNPTQAFSQILQTSVARVSAATFDSNLIPSSTNSWSLGATGNLWNSLDSYLYFQNNGTNVSAVGINTQSPGFPLTVNGTTSATAYCINGASCITSWPAGLWVTTSSNSIYNTNSGNVGIGTSNPTNVLDIATSSSVNGITLDSIYSGNTYTVGYVDGLGPGFTSFYEFQPRQLAVQSVGPGGLLLITRNSGDAGVYPSNGNDAGPIVFSTNGYNHERMRITTTGSVGIGTNSPGSYKLAVAGSVAVQNGGNLEIDNAAMSEGGVISYSGQSPNGYLAIAPAGSVTTYFYDTGVTRRVNNSQYWDQSSDERLKTNIQTIPDALGFLGQLRGVSFNWKDPERFGNETSTQLGFIAQEVQKVFPQWVNAGGDGYLSINPSGIDAVLVNGINEEDAKVKALEERDAALEAENAALKKWACSQPDKPSFCD